MRIAIASGKGGAGKTSVTASLGSVWPAPHSLVDTDLEAPNLHLFLHPSINETRHIFLSVPTAIDPERCTSCAACRDICRYGAIARFGTKISLFSNMCHGCAGCFQVCTPHALIKGERELGTICSGTVGEIPYYGGATRIGEVMTPPLLRALFRYVEEAESSLTHDILFDAPPGISCPAMTVASRVDALLLVADSTPFGVHDFVLAVQAFGKVGIPLFAVINRAGLPENATGDACVRKICEEQRIPLLAELPFERRAAEAYSCGKLLADISPEWRSRFQELANKLIGGEEHA